MKCLFRKPARFSLIVFLLPLAFAAYYCDFKYGTMAGYAAACLLTCLPWLLDRTLPPWVLFPAHLLSLLQSLYCNSLYGQTVRWVSYCKPLTIPQQFILQHGAYMLVGWGIGKICRKSR